MDREQAARSVILDYSDYLTSGGLAFHFSGKRVCQVFVVIWNETQYAVERWQRGWKSNPLRHGLRNALFRLGCWSIYSDAGTGRFACDLRDGASDPYGSEAGRPEFEVEGATLGFVVRCHRILFVDGKDV